MSSPTQRSLAFLREDGWFAAITEKWNQHVRIRQDLFGFIDVIAIKGNYTLAIQTTTGPNASERVKKILALPAAKHWASSPFRLIVVHAWAKRGERGKRKLWTCKETAITSADFD